MEGIGWYSHEIITRLVKRLPHHEFFLLFDRPQEKSWNLGPNVREVVLIPPARHPVLWWIWFEQIVPAFLKKNQIDLFLSPDGYGSLNTKVRQFIVCHDLAYLHFPEQVPFLVRKYYEYYVPKHLMRAEKIFAVSESTRKDIMEHFQIEAQKIELAFNGSRPEFVPIAESEKETVRKQFSGGQPFLLFVGAMHPRKNITHLIKAFDRFKKDHPNNIQLLLVGRKAWMTNDMEFAYQNSPYKNEIKFLPYLNKEDLTRLTASAWASIMPSFLEGFGVPVLEALQCDIPVLISNRFSLPEVGGPGAITFQPDMIESISNALGEMYLHPNMEERLKLIRSHRKKFSWDHTAEVFATAIETLKI